MAGERRSSRFVGMGRWGPTSVTEGESGCTLILSSGSSLLGIHPVHLIADCSASVHFFSMEGQFLVRAQQICWLSLPLGPHGAAHCSESRLYSLAGLSLELLKLLVSLWALARVSPQGTHSYEHLLCLLQKCDFST